MAATSLTASQIAFEAEGGVAAGNLQDAVVEVAGDAAAGASSGAAASAAVTAHTGDASDAHDASAVSVTGLSSLEGDSVQDVLADLDTRVPAVESSSAADIAFTPAGDLTADDVQAAIEQAATLGGAGSGPGVGTTIGETTIVGGNPTITYASNWGIDSSGNPYYDSDGAASGEDAILTVHPDTAQWVLVQPEGTTL